MRNALSAGRIALVAVVVVLATLGLPHEMISGQSFTPVPGSDFNGDGFEDLAMGVPGEDFESLGVSDGGMVNVVYGSAGGLDAAMNDRWHQARPGIEGSVEDGDGFGSAIATADFNGDGYDDLAVGVPAEDLVPVPVTNGGVVNVIYGSAAGLVALGNQIWGEENLGAVGSEGEDNDAFGASLVSADFNGDGYFDLAVGIPGETIGGEADAGAVAVIYGSAGGLTALGSMQFDQDSPGVKGVSEAGDGFGSSLAAGDFNGDGFAELAVGIPGEDLGAISDAGVIAVFMGSSSGLEVSNDTRWNQDSPGLGGFSAESDDEFGTALSVGDLNGDGYWDLAIGVPGEGLGGKAEAGLVNVFYGSSDGIAPCDIPTCGFEGSPIQGWHQGSPGVYGAIEAGDRFGSSVAVGDTNGDGYDDLFVGVPMEADAVGRTGGMVHVLPGSPSGVTSNESYAWYQVGSLLANWPEDGDMFGATLTTFDANGDGFLELVIGVPGEDLGGAASGGPQSAFVDAGSTMIIYGQAETPVTPTGASNGFRSEAWHQGTPGVFGAMEDGDVLSKALTS